METIKQEALEISWSAPESHFFEKSNRWYIGSAIIAGLIIVFSLWQENFLFVAFTVIAEILVLFWGGQKPRTIQYRLTPEGVVVGDRLFRFRNITGYALIESLGGPHYYELVFRQKQIASFYIKALVPNEQAPAIGDFLEGRLERFEYTPSVSEALMSRLGL